MCYKPTVKGGIILIICLFTVSIVYAQKDTVNYSVPEKLSSRFYFPGSIGISVPFKNIHTKLKDGLSINTAAEYRPLYINAVFFRLNYDALNNNYISYVHSTQTNIIQGKLSTQFIVAGAGYRKKLKGWAAYALVQPGLCIRSFDKAVNGPEGVIIQNVSTDSFAIKTDLGLEYYIAPHFAAVAGPSFYRIFSTKGFNAYHSQSVALSIGITTTIF